MNTKHLVIGAGLVVAMAQPVPAHHSFAAEFDANKPVTLKGTVTRLSKGEGGEQSPRRSVMLTARRP
jgi:hypothetical protein